MRLQILGWESEGLRCADSKINLELDGVKKLNLIQMPNGTGKTTTLELIQVSMTGEANTWDSKKIETFKSKNKSVDSGQFTLHLNIDKSRLTFNLNIDFEKKEVIYRTTSPAVGGSVEGWKPPSEYRRFLVKSFVGLFIFDGEFSKKLLSQAETEAEKAIDALCQLYLLDEGSRKLNEYWEKSVEAGAKTPKGLSMWKKKLEKLKTKSQSLIRNRKNTNTALIGLTKNIDELNVSIEKRLAAEGGKLGDWELAKEKAHKSNLNVINNAEIVMGTIRQPYLVDILFGNALTALKASMVKLQIPKETSKQFFIEIAEASSCICGESMNEQRKASILQRSENYLGSEITGELNALKNDINDYTSRMSISNEVLSNTAEDLQNSIDQNHLANTEVATLKQQLIEGISEEIKEDQQQVISWENNKKDLEYTLEMLDDEDDGSNDPESYSIASIKRQYKEAKNKVSEISDNVLLNKQIELVRNIFDKVILESRREITLQLVAECNSHLNKIMKLNPVTIKNIDKSLQLEGQEGASTGQTLAVGYSFLSTLLNRGKNKFPFVVDSPANPLDPEVRTEIATMIPKLCDQMIAFVIPHERPDFIPPLVRSCDGDVRYLTTFRINEGSQHLLNNLPDDKFCNKTDDGVLVYGEDYFNSFMKNKE